MRPFAERFYKSKAWEKCRAGYAASVRGLCERCMAADIYRAGVIVHHKIPLSPENINDPHITLDWGNLQLLCRDCHAAVHDAKQRRYKLDDMGRVIFR